MGKSVLIAGASGLVGYAAMKHFGSLKDSDVTVLSRRQPRELFGARFIAADLADDQRCATLGAELQGFTHFVYTALHERPRLIAGWRDEEHIRVNDRMFRNLFHALEPRSPDMRHVTLLQGTKAYGVHVKAIPTSAREDRDEWRAQPNFYWRQEDFLKERQKGRSWSWTIFRPQMIFGESIGSAMNLIPAIGAYAALLKEDGQKLHYPGGDPNLIEATDADLLSRAIAWAGESAAARDQIFNVTNGDVFRWPEIWPVVADALGMQPGDRRPLSLEREMAKREDDWSRIRQKYRLLAPSLTDFVGLSFQYADACLGYNDERRADPSLVSTIKLRQAGFHECMNTEGMLRKWFRRLQSERFLPPV
jgi:nucleoside-diphosphate-sugar epimerase